jgi:hypothetical protein
MKLRMKYIHIEIIKRIPIFRCGGCKYMELERRSFYEPLFKKIFYREYSKIPEYTTITASVTKSLFFLNDDDLLELKYINTVNHHHRNVYPIRMFKW